MTVCKDLEFKFYRLFMKKAIKWPPTPSNTAVDSHLSR